MNSSLLGYYNQRYNDNAEYELIFETLWGSNLVPINSPPDAHTGNFFVVTHNQNYDLFLVGELASLGISNTSTYGTVDDLLDETRGNSAIYMIYTAPVIMLAGTGGQQVFRVQANRAFPLVSLSTMAAPSPDWFIGISSLSLIDQNGQWITEKIVPLWVYDAGIDAGLVFKNGPIAPREIPIPIRRIRNGLFFTQTPGGEPIPIAYLRVRRIR